MDYNILYIYILYILYIYLYLRNLAVYFVLLYHHGEFNLS